MKSPPKNILKQCDTCPKDSRRSRAALLAKEDSDSDLLGGRFARKGHRTDEGRPRGTSVAETTTTASEDVLKEFLAPELRDFFATKNDGSLFVKALAADGIESCFKSSTNISNYLKISLKRVEVWDQIIM